MKLPKFLQPFVSFCKELFTNYSKDNAFTLGASLAYYTVFSFGPMLVLGFMLLVTLVVNAIIGGFVEQIAAALPLLGPTMLKAFTMSLDLGLSTVIFALLFRFLPDARDLGVSQQALTDR